MILALDSNRRSSYDNIYRDVILDEKQLPIKIAHISMFPSWKPDLTAKTYVG